jgi:hypothetical protein
VERPCSTCGERRVKKDGNILHIIEGKIEETRRCERRHNQLLVKLRREKVLKYSKKAVDGTIWRTLFGRGQRPVVRQNTE